MKTSLKPSRVPAAAAGAAPSPADALSASTAVDSTFTAAGRTHRVVAEQLHTSTFHCSTRSCRGALKARVAILNTRGDLQEQTAFRSPRDPRRCQRALGFFSRRATCKAHGFRRRSGHWRSSSHKRSLINRVACWKFNYRNYQCNRR